MAMAARTLFHGPPDRILRPYSVLSSSAEGRNGMKGFRIQKGLSRPMKVRFHVKAKVSSRVQEILRRARRMNNVSGAPYWFSPPECGEPPPNSPLLLYIPGIDGTGLGMALHHKALGGLFEVRCLYIPIMNRTSFEGLVSMVENTLKMDHRKDPLRPIYLVGDCLGGCLAIAAAANNPDIDLTLILVNPGTCFSKSSLWPWLSLLEIINEDVYSALPLRYEESMALGRLLPRESLLWRLRVFKSAEEYANSRLGLLKHNVLVLASGKDELLQSKEEALRLKKIFKSCKIRYFKDSGHCLLLEEDFYLSTVIKGAGFYRKSRLHDSVCNFMPPTGDEQDRSLERNGTLIKLTSPVFFSTNESGEIMEGLSGIPEEGPVLFVGIHMLMGLEMSVLVSELLKKRKILLRGVAHPLLFDDTLENDLQEPGFYDDFRLFGAVPSTPRNLHKLFSSKAFILLYPGGAREALHRKGEHYKLFWPEKQEFVRMAAQFEATIVPFGIVGEDDIVEVVLNYEDLLKVPIYNDMVRNFNKRVKNIRKDVAGEVSNQPLYFPAMLPKPPGRIYALFGRPIRTAERKEVLKDRAAAQHLYLEVKSDVEKAITYLIEKRKQDPYRYFLPRFIYEALSGFKTKMPTFKL